MRAISQPVVVVPVFRRIDRSVVGRPSVSRKIGATSTPCVA
jgi:hypothetical protein